MKDALESCKASLLADIGRIETMRQQALGKAAACRELVDKYAGKYAVVAEGELFVGYDSRQLDEEARRKHPGVIPTGLRIPHPEDFTCAL